MILVFKKPRKTKTFLDLSNTLRWSVIVTEDSRCYKLGLKHTVRTELVTASGETVRVKIFAFKSKKRRDVEVAWAFAHKHERPAHSINALASAVDTLNDLIALCAWGAASLIEARLLSALQDQHPVCAVDWEELFPAPEDLATNFAAANKLVDEAILALDLPAQDTPTP